VFTHSQAILESCLKQVIGNKFFGDSQNRLVIPAFNAVNGDIQLFKTAHCSAYRMDYRLPATSIALATSAAPTFFDAFTDSEGRVFLDGGVWANCPLVVGLTEATSALGWPVEQIDVLSIGTTSIPYDISHSRRQGGLLNWNVGVVELFQEAQIRGNLGIAKAMIGKHLLRIDQVTRPGRFSLDKAKEVSDLCALGENSARQSMEEISERFLSLQATPFTPLHSIDEESKYKSSVLQN
tara:strand:- start:12402 stop:13115 length:714 start_codon:yes stop_codon:yes gene_type:complete